ncbi:MAG: sulfotransferase [Pseudomonadota bacterium]|uniref:tetratricopeptide repeat-containing sulfotransferase family protein n=1 Tax=Sphingomonas sp. ERG5 TaxID=1381597 RepID=UPI0006915EB3|nr:tetratricopeptide repeat-containing sulfotransferase family protein [Sphingomonas sp. ERG5]
MTFPAIDDIETLLRTDPEPDQARPAIERFLAAWPTRHANLRLLARALRKDGLRAQAALIDQAILLAASRTPLVSTAIRAFAAGRHGDAEHLVRDALAHGRENMAATLLLAEIAAAAGLDEEAVKLYRTGLSAMPDDHEIKFKLANALFRLNQVTAAIAIVDDIVATRPDDMSAALLRLTMLGQIGEYDEAERGYGESLSRCEDFAMLWVGYAHLLKTSGKISDSIAAYRRALMLEPGLGEAWWGLADLKSGVLGEADIVTIEEELRHSGDNAYQALHLHFAAGKALEDARQYPASFKHYARGNAIVAAGANHDAAAQSDETDRTIRLFDQPFLADRKGAGHPSRAPIFILGMPRAGSTLIEQILSSHSLIEGTAELPYISLLAHRLVAERWSSGSVRYPDVVAGVDPAALAALGELYLEAAAVHRKTDRPYFIDKLPENWLHIGLIHLILPNAIIIDARRDPMACGFSNFKQHYAKGRSFASSLGDIGRYYSDYVRLLDHIDTVLPGRVHRVEHETLVTNTESEVRRLLTHIGVEFEASCLRFYENARPVRTASASQVRRPIDPTSGQAWQPYSQWLSPLADALPQRA